MFCSSWGLRVHRGRVKLSRSPAINSSCPNLFDCGAFFYRLVPRNRVCDPVVLVWPKSSQAKREKGKKREGNDGWGRGIATHGQRPNGQKNTNQGRNKMPLVVFNRPVKTHTHIHTESRCY